MFEHANLLDRMIWFGLGCLVGYLVGWIVQRQREDRGTLNDIKETLVEILEDRKKHRGDDGFMRRPLVADILMFTVVVIVAYSAFMSQRTSNAVEQSQEQQENMVLCNQQYLGQTIDVLNERTTFTTEAANANVELQKDQARFLAVVIKVGDEETAADVNRKRAALERYFDSLTEFTTLTAKSATKAEDNPFPTIEEYNQCLRSAG